MKYNYPGLLLLLLLTVSVVAAQKNKSFTLASPDGKIIVNLEAGTKMNWSVKHGQDLIIAPSAISLTLASTEVLGDNATVISSKNTTVNTVFNTPLYKKKSVMDHYNQLAINCKGDYSVIFRAYNDGVAYRFFTKKKGEIIISSEEANFNFDNDYKCFVPYVRDFRGPEQYIQSYEALYTEAPVSKVYKDTLGFLPILIETGNKRAVILEADLEDYPGMFISPNAPAGKGFKGVFAPYPLAEFQGGYNMLNTMVSKRAGYIATVNGTRSFPWRAVVISDNDAALANNDMVQKLASPSRIADESWIKPGKVAWDWWNDWNISHVDFKAGINTETYKYYIDFASANKVEYVVLDEGWSNNLDLMNVSGKINLKEIIDYGKQKNVGVILWASWYATDKKLDEAFSTYSSMGIKGFKIDFMDRDDQKMVASLYVISKKAAEYKLLLDYHGMYKPTGLQRTWPNVLNFEGVKGMENVKWTPNDDVPRYDVTIPFIRMMAGPMDYTPGAMRNSTKAYFRPNNSLPMSQGTRCHQLAMYVVFEAPLQMLADNPTAYMKEQESTDFIAKMPTVFDETVALDGKVGEYIALARKKNNEWFVGAMSNWNERDLVIDLSFLGEGKFEAEIFKDGMNANKDATDYKRQVITVSSKDKINIHLANGGGWAARIYPSK
ncbi:MAG: glycoside hydrolase family 97 protein [Ferruginibacter sp.]|nr:glycoside hydrolase family 97 protein [Ferruginibacter sp.]